MSLLWIRSVWSRIIFYAMAFCGAAAAQDVTADYKVADGFRLEKIYDVHEKEGSWVAVTKTESNKLLCADQYGGIYWVTPSHENTVTKVTPSNVKLAGAHSVLWHKNALYVAVTENVGNATGVYRVTDENKDGVFDEPIKLKDITGTSEHGLHSLVASPDGEWIYFIAGNYTDLPTVEKSMPVRSWQEDQLLPRLHDPRGHAVDRMAPGGHITRFHPDGSNWQLVSMGYRNAFDIAFNLEGELFTYDADMEWDFGLPWYRPTRICHALPGSDFGWRNGSGKFPEYYEDSMAPVVDIGPGCPTGLLSGKGAKFPEKYQRALFAFDWTYATIYAVHLHADGAGYKADLEEFITGQGLPLTDAVIGNDQNMYFLTGGRRTKSALWRVTYQGNESTQAIAPLTISHDFELRKKLGDITLSGDAILLNDVWRELASSDRTMRYAARVALERIPRDPWLEKLRTETDAWRLIHGAMALARIDAKEERATAWASLQRCSWAQMNREQRLNWLRTVGLFIIRMGELSSAERDVLLEKAMPLFPSDDDEINRELCRLLSYLQAPSIVAHTLGEMEKVSTVKTPAWLNSPTRSGELKAKMKSRLDYFSPGQNTFYAYCLRVVKGPWANGERERYLNWISTAAQRNGGECYVGYLESIRQDAMKNATDDERARFPLQQLLDKTNDFSKLSQIQGPGRQWTIAQVEKLGESLQGRNLEKGRQLYEAALCASCHTISGKGGSTGPQLDALGGRFTVHDVAEAILDPSKVVSDQYAFQTIILKDTSSIIAKVLDEKDGVLRVAASPFDLSQVTHVQRTHVSEIKQSLLSPMPPALINGMNEDELKDLLAYLLGK